MKTLHPRRNHCRSPALYCATKQKHKQLTNVLVGEQRSPQRVSRAVLRNDKPCISQGLLQKSSTNSTNVLVIHKDAALLTKSL